MEPLELTEEQKAAIERIRTNWSRIGEPQPTIGCDGAVVIDTFYENGNHAMWIIIEKDGYAHS